MGAKHAKAAAGRRAAVAALSAAFAACLAVSLFAAGFAVCAAQPTTHLLTSLFGDWQASPYGKDALVALVVETRGYTVSDYGRTEGGTDGARERFCRAVVDAAADASAEGSPSVDEWSARAREVARNSDRYASATECAFALAAVNPKYALDSDALDHLDDCYAIIGPVVPRLWAVAGVAAACFATLCAMGARRSAGLLLEASPAVLLAFLAACGIWAAIDFNAFFGVFHALLFPQGNWTFPADSLLICMLPLNFWVSMGALWLAVSVSACIIAMLAGKRLRKDA